MGKTSVKHNASKTSNVSNVVKVIPNILLIISLILVLSFLISCDIEVLSGDENVNDYIYPYLEFSPAEDGEGYTATVVEGATLTEVYIPEEIEVDGKNEPIVTFEGFENSDDASSLKKVTLQSMDTFIAEGALEKAENLENIQVITPSVTQTWGTLVELEKPGMEFDGWYLEGTDIKVQEGDVIYPNYTTIEPRWRNHTLQYFAPVAATCTINGMQAHYKCQSCQKLFTDENALNEVAKADLVITAGHTLTQVEAKQPTCIESGNVAHYKCQVCNLLFSDVEATSFLSSEDTVLSALGHSSITISSKASTCTETGYNAHYKCERCEKLFTDQNCTQETTEQALITAELGHEWEYKHDSTTSGHWEECSRCHETRNLDNPNEHELEYHQKVEATCTTAGTEAYYQCKDCQAYFQDSQAINEIEEPVAIPENGHQYGSTYYVEDGYHYKKCVNCQEGRLNEDHSYTQITEGRTPVVSQTCTSGAVYKKSCVCGKESEETFIHGVGYGHSQAVAHAKEESNCTTQGHKAYYTCTKECCTGKFYEDAALENEVTWEDLKLPLADHVCTNKFRTDSTSHIYICDVCGGDALTQAHTKTYAHDYYVHHWLCNICEYESQDVAPHTMTGTTGSRVCVTCGYSETESQNNNNSFKVQTVDKEPDGTLTARQEGITWTFTLTSTNPNAEPDTYIWYLDGEKVSWENINTYVLEAPGKHTYRVMCVFSSEGRYSSKSMTITGGT